VAKHSLEELDSLRTEQQERVEAFQELLDVANAYQRLSKSSSGFFSFFSSKKVEPEIDIDALVLTHEALKQEVLREENIKTLLERAVFNEALVKKLAVNRQHLMDHKPCQLCGALEHPYSKNPPPPTNSQQTLFEQHAKIKNLLAKTYSVNRQIEEARQQDEAKLSNRARRQRLSSQWLSLSNRLNAMRPDLDIQNISLMEKLLKEASEELKEITTLASHQRQKEASVVKLTASIEKSTASIERLQESVEAFSTEVAALEPQQAELAAEVQQCQQQEQQLAAEVLNQLTALGEKMPSRKDSGVLGRLVARKEEYQHYLARHQAAQQETVLFTEKRSTCEAEIQQSKTQLETLNSELQNEESIGLQLTIVEKQKLIADKEHLIAQQDAELAQLQQTLLTKIQNTEYSSLSALNEMLTLVQSQSHLEQKLSQVQADIAAKTATLEKTQASLEADTKLAEAGLSPEELTVQLKQNKERVELSNMEVQRLQKQLTEQKTQQQKHAQLQAQLQQQQAEAQPYLAELALLTAENGIAFRRRVQQQLANKLLAQTNSILEKISGRYYLRQLPSEQGLSLVVEDTLQGNSQRLPKTLSGGESFVISLGLALGLAELASNGRSIDSLFIDEGFGNLDAETLYTIISTLESLHTHGKTVGVISHVEAVQQRFKAQLQIVKKTNGRGMLKQAS
jgi:exonuclease SbcC